MKTPAPSLKDFIATHVVFRFDEAVAAVTGSTPEAIAAGLSYHCRLRHLRRLRRGLYCRTPNDGIDPWLLGSRLTTDAIIAYESALLFHANTTYGHSCEILTQQRFNWFQYNDVIYRGVRLKPRSQNELKRGPRFRDGYVEEERDGLKLLVCTKERAYADCFDRLDLTSGMKALADRFLAERELDLELLVDHALVNGSRIANARLGLLLELHRKWGPWEGAVIQRLMDERPDSPTIFDSRPNDDDDDGYGGRLYLVSRWNTLIPRWFLEIRQNLM